jgi:GNAT superfamily N-acetyltransferase
VGPAQAGTGATPPTLVFVAVTVERVEAELTFPLRRRILRPHETLEQLVLRGDDDPQTAHYAAIVGGEVVGTASVRREAPPWAAQAPGLWRLRGMATAEEWRNRGVGATVLAAVVEHVRSHGGGLLWCTARTPASGFYLRAGFTTRGEEWVDPVLGPHIAMEQMV